MICNQNRNRSQQNSGAGTEQAHYRPLNHENAHDASGCRAHRVKDGNVSATLDYNQDQRGSDIQSGDENYEPDNYHTNSTLKREGGKQRPIRLLPINRRIGTAEQLLDLGGSCFNVIDVSHLNTNNSRRMGLTGNGRSSFQRQIDPG